MMMMMCTRQSLGKTALLLLGGLLVGGCNGEDEEIVRCVDPAAVAVLPSPAWQQGPALVPPPGDYAVALATQLRPEWVAPLSRIDGWPRMPDLIIPLSQGSPAVDVDQITVYAKVAGEWEHAPTLFEAQLAGDDAASLALHARAPLHPESDEVIVVIRPGAVEGAEALPACGADGEPHPDYLAARSALPADAGDVQLALPLRLATASSALGRLGETLSAQPVLAVQSAEARTLDSFGEKAPPADVAALLGPTAVAGILELPDYRRGSDGFELDAAGVPVAADVTRPGFVAAVPASGSAPYPFVLFQHGGGQDKADFFQLAGSLAAAGFAFVAIDLPAHGDRAGGAAGTDMDFLNFDDPLKTRENFRQAVADHQAVLTGIAALNEALDPLLGLSETLDAERGFYMGLSLGGITGSLTFATAPQLRAAALFVAGAGYSALVQHGFFRIMVNDVLVAPPVQSAVTLALMETLLDGADPAAYALRTEDRTRPPRPALFMQAVDDPIVSMPTNDALARAFGAALALPADHEVPAMDEVTLPAEDSFAWPEAGGDTATRLLVHHPMNEVPQMDRHGALILQSYAQQMVAHCFSTLLADGSCEVIDTGFASH